MSLNANVVIPPNSRVLYKTHHSVLQDYPCPIRIMGWLEFINFQKNCNMSKYGNCEFTIVKIPSGEMQIYFRQNHMFRDTHNGFYLEEERYIKVLPYLLEFFGIKFWTLDTHYYLSCFVEYKIDENRQIVMESPCHRMVLSTILCSTAFPVYLPLSILIQIFSHFPQDKFRENEYWLDLDHQLNDDFVNPDRISMDSYFE